MRKYPTCFLSNNVSWVSQTFKSTFHPKLGGGLLQHLEEGGSINSLLSNASMPELSALGFHEGSGRMLAFTTCHTLLFVRIAHLRLSLLLQFQIFLRSDKRTNVIAGGRVRLGSPTSTSGTPRIPSSPKHGASSHRIRLGTLGQPRIHRFLHPQSWVFLSQNLERRNKNSISGLVSLANKCTSFHLMNQQDGSHFQILSSNQDPL